MQLGDAKYWPALIAGTLAAGAFWIASRSLALQPALETPEAIARAVLPSVAVAQEHEVIRMPVRGPETAPVEDGEGQASEGVPLVLARVGLVVVEACSGRPLPSAKVEVRSMGQGSAVSGEERQWGLSVPAGVPFTAIVGAPGFRERSVEIDPRLLDLAGTDRFIVRLACTPGNALHVVDRHGEPIAGARVTAKIGPPGAWESTHAFVRNGDVVELVPNPAAPVLESLERNTDGAGCVALLPCSGPDTGLRIEGWVECEGYLRRPFEALEEPMRGSEWKGGSPPMQSYFQYVDSPRHAAFDAVVLDRAATVEGRVLDESGLPAADVKIQISLYAWSPPSWCGTGRQEGGSWGLQSDADGLYRFQRETIQALHPTHPDSEGLPADRPLNWFLVGPEGGVLAVASDTLREGGNRRDWRLQSPPRLTGVLRDVNGTGLAGERLVVRSTFELPQKTAVTDEEGCFAFERIAWGGTALLLADADSSDLTGVLVQPDDVEVQVVLRRDGRALELESTRRIPRSVGLRKQRDFR